MPALYTHQVFPGGRAKTLVISPTAGNVDTNLSPGIGMRWVIQRARLILTTNATVATRNILTAWTDGTNVVAFGVQSANCAASGSTTLNLLPRNYPQGGALGIEANGEIGEVVISEEEQLRIYIGNGVAGDSYEGLVSVREMAVD